MSGPVSSLIEPRARDLGGFEVRRVLPAPERQMVGPFIFFDHMGPADFPAGRGVDVRPHPHIGLATVTYLFEGELVHRDSLESEQPIRPGDVNWMIAGRGIVHSERTAPALRSGGHRLHGIQSWVALPKDAEESEPGFFHHPAASLPLIDLGPVRPRLLAGSAYGHTSPVTTCSETFYLDAPLAAGASLTLPADYEERAVYVAEGAVQIAEQTVAAGTMAVLAPGGDVVIKARSDSRAMLLGGAPLDGPRYLWWNFVASSPERIERAKADWADGRFAKVPGDDEFIPLPEN